MDTGGKADAKKKPYATVLRCCLGVLAALLLALTGAPLFLDEPLRAFLEKKINDDLKGYSVRLPKLHLQLVGLSLTLKDLTVLQQAHPAPPLLRMPVLTASIHWRALLSGRLVAKLMLDRPIVNLNMQQLLSEAANPATLKERGWQRAVEDVSPLKINSVQVKDASVTYTDHNPGRPLVLSHLNLQATNIRNIRLPDQIYPSAFHLDTAIFGNGHGSIDGAANFLGEPYPGIKGRIKLAEVPVDYFSPIFARSNLSIRGGVLQALGEAEYAPKMKRAHLEKLTIRGMSVDYHHLPLKAGADKRRLALPAKQSRKIGDQTGLSISADQMVLTECSIGLVNETPGKKYRLFFSDTELRLNNFSNRFALGPAQARLKGKFMGSGQTTATAILRAEQAGPDFDLQVKVEDGRLTALNDLLRAYGNFDVAAGSFSLISELKVRKGALSGYVKPFFKNVKVYDRKQDKGRGVLHQMYEMLVGGAAGVLENRTRREVAAKAVIKGSLGSPETSSWQIVGQLVKNGFVRALVPGFETAATR
jgi:hypothetical protein